MLLVWTQLGLGRVRESLRLWLCRDGVTFRINPTDDNIHNPSYFEMCLCATEAPVGKNATICITFRACCKRDINMHI